MGEVVQNVLIKGGLGPLGPSPKSAYVHISNVTFNGFLQMFPTVFTN